MISFEEINSKERSPELRDIERGVLKSLEELTDTCINTQYPNGSTIYIRKCDTNKLMESLGVWRRYAVHNAWVKLYEAGGWKFTLDEDGDWIIYAKD